MLRQRHVGQWPRIREDTAHVRIGGNADDRGRRGPRLADRHLPPYDVGGTEHLPCREFAQDHDAWRGRPVAIVETASTKDLHPQRSEHRGGPGDRRHHLRVHSRGARLFQW